MSADRCEQPAGEGINVLALIKGEERYVFLYDDESPEQLLQMLGEYAEDPDLSFNWYDAAIMSQRIAKIRNEIQERARTKAYNAMREGFGKKK